MKKLFIIMAMLSATSPVFAQETSNNSPDDVREAVEEFVNDITGEVKKEFELADLETVFLPLAPRRVPGEFGEKQLWLNLGDPAPYDGVIVNVEGWGYILSEYQAVQDRANAALEQQRKLDLTKLNLEVGNLQLELDANQERNKILLEGKDREIKRQRGITDSVLKDKSSKKRMVFIGIGTGAAGVLLGILLKAFAL